MIMIHCQILQNARWPSWTLWPFAVVNAEVLPIIIRWDSLPSLQLFVLNSCLKPGRNSLSFQPQTGKVESSRQQQGGSAQKNEPWQT